MQAYAYKAAMLCEPCALAVRENLAHSAPPQDDSDRYPCGPYAGGGGEADTPQHCDQCRTFLRNPLTDDGRRYVQDALRNRVQHSATLEEWAEFYGLKPTPDGWRVYLRAETAEGRTGTTWKGEGATMACAFRLAHLAYIASPDAAGHSQTLARHYHLARAEVAGRTSIPCATSTALEGGFRYVVEIFRPRGQISAIQAAAYRRTDRMRSALG